MKYLVIVEVQPKPTDEGEFPKINDLVKYLATELRNLTANDNDVDYDIKRVMRIHNSDMLT